MILAAELFAASILVGIFVAVMALRDQSRPDHGVGQGPKP